MQFIAAAQYTAHVLAPCVAPEGGGVECAPLNKPLFSFSWAWTPNIGIYSTRSIIRRFLNFFKKKKKGGKTSKKDPPMSFARFFKPRNGSVCRGKHGKDTGPCTHASLMIARSALSSRRKRDGHVRSCGGLYLKMAL